MFSFFDKSNRGNKFDGYSILNPSLNLDSIPQNYAIQYYLQIYKEMAEILDVAFSGYTVGENTYIPIDEYVDSMFDDFSHIMQRFDIRPEMDKLPITTLSGFKLNGDFVTEIRIWNSLKEDIVKDVDYLSKNIPIRKITPPDLQLAFDRIDGRLKEHQIKKDKLFKIKKLSPTEEVFNLGAKKSTTRTILEMLYSANGEFVTLQKIEQVTGLDRKYLRIIIDGLKKKKTKDNKSIKIEASGEGSYNLIILN
jgi:hypothetical protein